MPVNDTTIPADAIAGLLVGWTGPVEYRDALGEWGPTCCDNGRWPGAAVHMDPDRIRLDCLRPEVQARVGRVLAAGVRCAACSGPAVLRDDRCPDCDDYGYLRKPSPIWHILDAARTNTLSNQHIAEAVAHSVRNVARGGEVLRNIKGDWSPLPDGLGVARADVIGEGTACWVTRKSGWLSAGKRGPETGPEGRAKADAALLAANIAYIDGGALVLPDLPLEPHHGR